MKWNWLQFKRATGLICVFHLALYTYVNAQIQQVQPIDFVRSIEPVSDQQFFHPVDPGIPAGDINGDGTIDHLFHVSFSADLSTPELGDFTDKTMVCTYDMNDVKTGCTIYEGGLLFPAGDLNDDGRGDLAMMGDGALEIFSFPEGPIDISQLPDPIFSTDVIQDFDQFLGGYSLDIDANEDLIVASNDFNDGSFIGVLFGDSDPANFEFELFDVDNEVGDLDVRIGAGDVVGDTQNEIVALASTPFPCSLSSLSISAGMDRTLSVVDNSDLGSCTDSAERMRLFVANADGEYKDDIIFSPDRSFQPGLFQQVFFNEPNVQISQTTGIAENPFTPPRILRSGTTVDQVIPPRLDDNLGVRVWFNNRVDLEVCLGVDMLGPGEGSGEVCTNPQEVNGINGEGDQFFPSPNLGFLFAIWRKGDSNSFVRIGTFQQEDYSAGTARVTTTPAGVPDVVNIVTQALFNTFLLTNNTHIAEPSVTGLPFGLFTVEHFFSFGFSSISLQAAVGLRISLVNDNVRSNTGSEPASTWTLENLRAAQSQNGLNFLGSTGGFHYYFGKRVNNEEEQDTSMIVHSIDVTDFQELDENSFINSNNIGDVNNDGFQDFMIGSRFSLSGLTPINEGWIFFGSENFNSTMPDVTIDFTTDENISGTDNVGVGGAIEFIGDVNGDDIHDFAVGLPGYLNEGAVFVYFGGDTPDFSTPDVVLRPQILAGQTISSFGNQITGGDFDGDGFYDVAVTADNAFGSPAPPTVQVFKGGAMMDGTPDYFPSATRDDLGREGTDIVSTTFGNTIQFLPKENSDMHQDLLFVPGGFSGWPDAVIFEGGAMPDSVADIQLVNANRNSSFGFGNRAKASARDLNDDGFYDIALTNFSSNEDAFVSSRTYIFSPNSGITVSNEDETENPLTYRLSQNYPNPFNPTTNIEFLLPQASNVSLKVYDLLGREVASLLNNVRFGSGSQTVTFDASSLSSGIYLYRLEAGNFVQTRKMTLIK